MSGPVVLTVAHELRISGETMAWLDGLLLRAARAFGEAMRDTSGEGAPAREAGASLSKPPSPEPDTADGAAGHQAKVTAPVRDPDAGGRPVEPGPQVSGAGQGGTPFGTAVRGAPPAPGPAPDLAPVADRPARATEPATVTPGAPMSPFGAVSSRPAAVMTGPAETPAPAGSRTSDTAGAAFSDGAGPAQRNWSEAEIRRAFKMRNQGISYDEIGKALGRKPTAVQVKMSTVRTAGRIPDLTEADDTPADPVPVVAIPEALDTPAAEPVDQEPEPCPAPAAPVPAATAAPSAQRGAGPTTSAAPLRRSAAEILRWCALVKLDMPRLDLARINQFRAGKGMPPFDLVTVPAPGPGTVTPHRATKAAIWQWARNRGLCLDQFDLGVINETAQRLGLPLFEIAEPARPDRGLH